MYNHRYMEKLECEIDALIKKEAMNKSDEVTYEIEKELHLLFENRRHLKEYIAERGDMEQTDKHKTSVLKTY